MTITDDVCMWVGCVLCFCVRAVVLSSFHALSTDVGARLPYATAKLAANADL